MKFSSIEDAIETIRDGGIIIVVDDEDRENEGDFICAADTITPEKLNFILKGRGLYCVTMPEDWAHHIFTNADILESRKQYRPSVRTHASHANPIDP